MALQTFTPPILPSQGTVRSQEVKIQKVEFGDGYTQETPEGLNHIRRKIELNWEVLTPTQRDTINSFFTARGGYEPFWYTPSDESSPVKWTCMEWSDTAGEGGYKGLRATLIQSFSLQT